MTAANQAGSWDLRLAMLIDKAGNDTYRGDGLSQGSAAMQAIAWLIDLVGNDHYVGAGTAIQGQGAGNDYHYVATGCFSWSLLSRCGRWNGFLFERTREQFDREDGRAEREEGIERL